MTTVKANHMAMSATTERVRTLSVGPNAPPQAAATTAIAVIQMNSVRNRNWRDLVEAGGSNCRGLPTIIGFGAY